MKRCCLILIFIIQLSNAKAQYWAANSSIWHIGIIESFSSVAQGYIKAEVIGDTLLLGQNCKVIHKTKYSSFGAMSEDGVEYMYYDSGKVYHYMNNSFYTLYNFNAIPGDSWTVAVPYPSPFCGLSFNLCDTLVQIIVDSVSTITIQSHSLKTLYVHSDSSDWYFLNPIIENIGSVGGFFPFIYEWMDFDIPYLRCYQDSLINYQTNFSISLPCDSLLSNIDNSYSIYHFNVFPNPVTDYLNVITEVPETDFILYDLSSRALINERLNNSSTINLTSLANGIYIYEIRNKLRVVSMGKLIKQ